MSHSLSFWVTRFGIFMIAILLLIVTFQCLSFWKMEEKTPHVFFMFKNILSKYTMFNSGPWWYVVVTLQAIQFFFVVAPLLLVEFWIGLIAAMLARNLKLLRKYLTHLLKEEGQKNLPGNFKYPNFLIFTSFLRLVHIT